MKLKLFIAAITVLALLSCSREKPVIQYQITRHAHLAGLPSASGVEYAQNNIYIIGDDIRWLLTLDDQWEITDSLALSSVDTLVNNRTPGKVKADFESLAFIKFRDNNYLLVLSSGSRQVSRDTAYLVNLTAGITFIKKNIRPLYEQIKQQTGIPDDSEINIEGLAVSDKAAYLFHRGNINENFVVAIELSRLMDYLMSTGNALPELTLYEFNLPAYKDVPSGFSGACIVSDPNGILFTASLEDTESEVADGTILGSYIGFIPLKNLDKKTFYSVLLTDNDKTPIPTKLESIVVKSKAGNKLTTIAVSDNDDGSSDIFELEITLNNLD